MCWNSLDNWAQFEVCDDERCTVGDNYNTVIANRLILGLGVASLFLFTSVYSLDKRGMGL